MKIQYASGLILIDQLSIIRPCIMLYWVNGITFRLPSHVYLSSGGLLKLAAEDDMSRKSSYWFTPKKTPISSIITYSFKTYHVQIILLSAGNNVLLPFVIFNSQRFHVQSISNIIIITLTLGMVSLISSLITV